MSVIEPKILWAVALGLLLLLALGLLLRSGLKFRRRPPSSKQQSAASAVRSQPQTGLRATPLIAPGPTVLPADDAVIDLRVSFDKTESRPLDRTSAATTVAIAVTNSSPSPLLRSIASELAQAGYYLRTERPSEGWLRSVYDRRQNHAGELAASRNDAETSKITLSMRDYGAPLELVDRATKAAGYVLLTRDRVQDRHQYSYLHEAGGRVRATLTEAASQVLNNG